MDLSVWMIKEACALAGMDFHHWQDWRLKALAAKTSYNVNTFPLMPLAALKSHAKNLPAIHQTEMTGN